MQRSESRSVAPPIGFDPVKWVQRLRDVNEGSQFKPAEKVCIERHLRELQRTLENGDLPPPRKLDMVEAMGFDV